MSVVAREDDGAPAGTADVEQLFEGSDVPRGPGHAYLIALGQMVVDGVDHDAHHTALGLGDGVDHPPRNPCGAGRAQVSLVEQDRRRSRRAGCTQPRVHGEPVFLRRGVPGPERAAQQARARRLGHGGQGGNHRRVSSRLVRHQSDPPAPREIVLQLPEHRHAHRVDDQEQHPVLPGQRYDPAIEYRLDAQQAPVPRFSPGPTRQELAELAVLVVARGIGLVCQTGVRLRKQRRGIAVVPEAPTRPVHEPSLGTIRARRLPERPTASCAASSRCEPARQSQGHLDTGRALRFVYRECMVEHAVGSASQRLRDFLRVALDERSQLAREPLEPLIEGRPQHPAAPGKVCGAELLKQQLGVGEHRVGQRPRLLFARVRRRGTPSAQHHTLCRVGPCAGQLRVQFG